MFYPGWIRRFAAVGLLVLATCVFAPFPAVADDSGDGAQAEAASSEGVLETLLDWISGLVEGSEPTEGDTGAGIDPLG